MAKRVFLGLGSNLGDRKAFLQRAIANICSLPGVVFKAKSSLYQTSPWGVSDQADYYNAVLEVYCNLPADYLLKSIQQIESNLGRIRAKKWGPRTADIDILLFGDEEIKQEGLLVPHPFLSERLFVLLPLVELDADLSVKGLNVADLLKKRLLYEKTHGIEHKIEKVSSADQW
ncbi:MAG: 2-amino-4-hydroxy-6-hydroxymethyldihydropteridine diphosphokinase [Bacillota bacterium]|jgi:2-amino-4-hydroxy-6-hydroxymethyldihydropteridine diphosphokinase